MKNNFEWNEPALSSFVQAINSSRLENLAFNTMSHGSIFVPYLLSHLDTNYLKSFKASMTAVTSDAAPVIANFIASPRCRLRSLGLSANNLGADGISMIVDAMQRNFSLRNVELFGNGNYSRYSKRKIEYERRNARLQHHVSREAVQLLRYSRLFLLPRTNSSSTANDSPILAAPSFAGLPLELKQYILTFLAPHLSSSQCLRIFNFASSPSTLPLLNLNTSASCLPDPSAMPFGLSVSTRSPCENGCIGLANSLRCRNDTIRADWLLKVQCDAPDPDSTPVQSPSPSNS